MTAPTATPVHKLRLAAALAAVYFGWGSTFLATRYAVETLPPLTITAVRALVAGAILFAVYYRKAGMPTRLQWRSAWIGGTLLFLAGQATMTRAMTLVPSGLSALVLPASGGMTTAAQLISGGLTVAIAAVVLREPAQITAEAFTPWAVSSLPYLIRRWAPGLWGPWSSC